jgi:predicted DsbA family dithiol-disulfide isomerase
VRIPTAKLDVVSDTICPWCYIGKRHLDAALSILAVEGFPIEVHWRPFQLNPNMPKDGVDRRLYRSSKFGSWEKSEVLDAQVTSAGATDGLNFHHELMTRTPNTVASHILVRLAYEIGHAPLQNRIVEALFAAYFTEGRDVGDHAVLAAIGSEAGLDRDSVFAAVADPAREAAVAADEQLARKLRLSGVPSFVLDGHYLFSGARTVGAMVDALREADADWAAANE